MPKDPTRVILNSQLIKNENEYVLGADSDEDDGNDLYYEEEGDKFLNNANSGRNVEKAT